MAIRPAQRTVNNLRIKNRYITFTLLLFSSACGATPINHVLPKFTARYAITKYDIKLAEAVYVLRYTRTGYIISQHTRLSGIAALFRNDKINAYSIIDKVNGQLRLQKFSYQQTGKKKNRDENILLSYNKKNNAEITTITGLSRNTPVAINTTGAVWDILSFQVPLMAEVTATKTRYPYMAVINGKLNQYTFNLTNKKKYDFANKSYQLLEMVRNNHEKTRALHIWLAPKLHNLPVVVENYRGGSLNSRMQLESVQFNNSPPLTANTDSNSDE